MLLCTNNSLVTLGCELSANRSFDIVVFFLAIYRLSTAYYVDKRHFIVNLFKEVCWHNGKQGNVVNSKRIKFKRLL